MRKKLVTGLLLILISQNIYAYTADCTAVWSDSPDNKQIFRIEVSNGTLTRYTNYGTFYATFESMYMNNYVYRNGESTEYLGKFTNGKFSYSSDVGNGDGLVGTCTLR